MRRQASLLSGGSFECRPRKASHPSSAGRKPVPKPGQPFPKHAVFGAAAEDQPLEGGWRGTEPQMQGGPANTLTVLLSEKPGLRTTP